MEWKNITVGRKALFGIVGIGGVLLLFAAATAWTFWGITGIVHEGLDTAVGKQLPA